MTEPERAVQTEPTVRLLFTAGQIAARVRELGLEIARDYPGKRPLFVGVLKGACAFQCDLARATPLEVELDFLSVTSYGPATVSSGTARLLHDLRGPIVGRDVVLCEGVVDSGLTVSFILELLRCSTRYRAGRCRCRWTTPDGRSAASSWWATAWMRTSDSATCPTWACSRRPSR